MYEYQIYFKYNIIYMHIHVRELLCVQNTKYEKIGQYILKVRNYAYHTTHHIKHLEIILSYYYKFGKKNIRETRIYYKTYAYQGVALLFFTTHILFPQPQKTRPTWW